MTGNGPGGTSRRVTAVIVGGGQAGLAASHCLAGHGIDHVVLERGQVAHAWRRQRWDSLQLLTPNWLTRLPGCRYHGPDPHGYMGAAQVADFISTYAASRGAPVLEQTRVTSVQQEDEGYRVQTDRGDWLCASVVIASGAFNVPVVPSLAAALPRGLDSLTPFQYRNPCQLAAGGVLVVGASATGLQLADEIQRSGRRVILAAGEHVRMPRTYRGRDILYWMHRTGLMDESWRAVDDIRRARRVPSPQLKGSPSRECLDLNSLAAREVEVVGRLAGVSGSTAQFSGSLDNTTKLADLKLHRLLDGIDDWIERTDRSGSARGTDRPAPTMLGGPHRLTLDLGSGEVRTVIWATGFRPDYSWLQVPVLDRKGMLIHDGGVVATPGLYALGLPFMRRRSSSFICGAAEDAREICDHLATYVRSQWRRGRIRAA